MKLKQNNFFGGKSENKFSDYVLCLFGLKTRHFGIAETATKQKFGLKGMVIIMKLSVLLKNVTVLQAVFPNDVIGYDTDISSVVTHSGKATENCLMICISGTKNDGNNYIDDAVSRGCRAVVTEKAEIADRYLSLGVAVIVTDSSRRAMSYIYDNFYGNPSKKMKYIAVTGTNGKTSVTYMLKSIFESSMIKCGLIGTVSCYSGKRKLTYENLDSKAAMTMPDPEKLYELLKFMQDDGVEYVFLEATSHALALDKLAPLHFKSAVFTNLTPDHLDFHGTMENYFYAKVKLFHMCDLAIINADDKYADRLKNEIGNSCRIVTCSLKFSFADYFASGIINYGVSGCEYRLNSNNLIMRIRCKIPGIFSVMNSLEAAVCAIEIGIASPCVYDALTSLDGIDGRMERINLCPGVKFTAFVDYAHTPDALENLLNTVRGFRKEHQRIVILFGCGGNRDRKKRPLMGEIATRLADKTIITSDNCREEIPEKIIDDIMSGVHAEKDITVIVNRREAIEYAVRTAEKDDILIFAGKGHENYEITSFGKRPFDEKKIISEAALKYRS